MFIGGGGMSGKCFVQMGQLGINVAIDCDKYGGWWMNLDDPPTPDMDHCHCNICDS